MKHHQLIYYSRPTFEVTARMMLDILRKSQANNDRRKVTGVLAFHDGRFIQLLEGRQEAVAEIMQKVRLDPRHADITVVLDEDTDDAPLSTWLMGFGTGDIKNTQLMAQPYCFSIEEVANMLRLKGGRASQAFLRLLGSTAP